MVIGLKELPKEIDIYQLLRTVHLRTGLKKNRIENLKTWKFL